MKDLPLSLGAAFDARSLDALKVAVKNDPQAGLKSAVKQMEGLFIQMMLKSMREASYKDGLFNNAQSDMFTSMYDQQITQNIADKGRMGFADLMIEQMTGKRAVTGEVTKTNPMPLDINPDRFPGVLQRMQGVLATREKTESPRSLMMEAPRTDGGFISRMLAPAIAVARSSGIPHQLIIAQAALESGWGNREILTRNGKPSHNLFGVKATSGWQGETTEITTTEYKDGLPQKVKGVFKVYPSYTEALSDYAALLRDNPRYRNILTASSPEVAAKALQSAGYATDPAYASKLIDIIQQVKSSINHAVKSYSTDLSSLF